MKLFRSEEGATIVFVAVSLLMLFGFIALAIDGGLGYDERRDTQGAADMSALAAAFASSDCEDELWEVAGLEAAGRNGFDNDGVSNTVSVSDISGTGDGPYRAEILSVESTAFASVIGQDEMSIAAEATASCVRQSGLGGYAVFASATSCPPDELKINASGLVIEGGVHSNGDLTITASSANPGHVVGDITWGGTELIQSVTSSGSQFQWDMTNPPPTPGGWTIDMYSPNAAAVAPLTGSINAGSPNYYSYVSDTVLSGNLADGIYFVDGDLTLQSIVVNSGTFVATGQITLMGSVNTLNTPYDSTGLGLFSDYPGVPDCVGGDIAIQWSASNNIWAGVQYAPNGRVVMSSADGSTFNGSIIAYRVDLSGANINITYDDTFTGIPVTSLRLLK